MLNLSSLHRIKNNKLTLLLVNLQSAYLSSTGEDDMSNAVSSGCSIFFFFFKHTDPDPRPPPPPQRVPIRVMGAGQQEVGGARKNGCFKKGIIALQQRESHC